MPESSNPSQSHLRLPQTQQASSRSPSSNRAEELSGRPTSSRASDSSPVFVSPSHSQRPSRTASPRQQKTQSSSSRFARLPKKDENEFELQGGTSRRSSESSTESWGKAKKKSARRRSGSGDNDSDTGLGEEDEDEDHKHQHMTVNGYHRPRGDPDEDDDDDDEDDPNMSSDHRPSLSRPTDGRSYTPLLNSKNESYDAPAEARPNGRPRRRSILRETDPDLEAKKATRKRYTYAGCFLLLSLVSFTVQTETAVYIQHNLKWNKAYAMLYFTHGSWSMLWFLQLAILRIQKRKMPWNAFWSRHVQILRQTAMMVEHQDISAPDKYYNKSPIPYMIKTTAFVTCALTIAGGSWYVAVDWTTASDLTAIYNCSAFFAYVFSVPLLKEQVRWTKVLAVLVAVAGVIVVAYGDQTPAKHGNKSGGGAGGPHSDDGEEPRNRSLGNLVIAIGSVLYGLYEVLYKRWACPPDGASPGRSMIFANLFGSLIGLFTLTVLWIPIPILHFLGIEKFEWPTGEASWMLAISVLGNAIFSGSFLVLISLTSPVLSSVAALLTIFLVALVDQYLPPPLNNPLSGAAVAGGLLIIVAFVVLCWATYREMDEERKKKADEQIDDSDEDVDLP